MKKVYIVITLILSCIIITSCSQKDESGNITLRYDGENQDAPSLAAQQYEAGVRFVPNTISNAVGAELTKIEYYIQEVPQTCTLTVYTSTNPSEPETVIWEKEITNIQANSWNSVDIDEDLFIQDSDLWITVNFKHNDARKVLGCDAGPAQTDGDWLLDYSDGIWSTLRSISSNNVDINWNIRATLYND